MGARPQIALDTNVLVAGLRSRTGASHNVIGLLWDDVYDLHVSIPVLMQYEDVLGRQREALQVSPEEAAMLLKALQVRSIGHEIFFHWRHVLPDPDDAAFLELAVAARAGYIVTHNLRHFAGCEAFGIRALAPIQLLRILGGGL